MQVARFSCGRRDPRRIQLAGPLKARSFAPGSGLPQAARAWRPLMQLARFSCGRRDPRRIQLAGPLRARSFAPGSGLPRSSPCVASPYAAGTLFLWGARPAANTACRPAQNQKLRPEGGAPTKAARAWRHFMQLARFSCGRRDPRRIQLAGPLKAKNFARGRASHEAARAWRRNAQPGLPRQHAAQLQAIAGMQIGQLRPQIFRQVYQHASRARRFGAFQVEAVVADHHQFARRHGPAVRQV